MNLPPLKDIEENSRHTVRCPACTRTPGLCDTPYNQMGPRPNGRHNSGRFKGYFRSAMPDCDFCKGLRVVFTNRICECGMPAVLWDEKENVWYCGWQNCAKQASWRKKYPLQLYSPNNMGSMGPKTAMDFYGKNGSMGPGMDY